MPGPKGTDENEQNLGVCLLGPFPPLPSLTEPLAPSPIQPLASPQREGGWALIPEVLALLGFQTWELSWLEHLSMPLSTTSAY